MWDPGNLEKTAEALHIQQVGQEGTPGHIDELDYVETWNGKGIPLNLVDIILDLRQRANKPDEPIPATLSTRPKIWEHLRHVVGLYPTIGIEDALLYLRNMSQVLVLFL